VDNYVLHLIGFVSNYVSVCMNYNMNINIAI